MKKIILLIFIIAIICFSNLSIMLSHSSVAAEKPKLIDGLEGSYNGVPVCHCPDDKANCLCNIN